MIGLLWCWCLFRQRGKRPRIHTESVDQNSLLAQSRLRVAIDMVVQHFLNIVIRIERERRVELPVNEIVARLNRGGIDRLLVNIRIDLHFLLVRRNIDIRFTANRVSPRRVSRVALLLLLIASGRHRSISRTVAGTRIDEPTRRVRTVHRWIGSFAMKGRWLYVTTRLRGHRWNRTRHNWTTRLTRAEQPDEQNRQTIYPKADLNNGFGSGILSKGRLRKYA